jgi:hypothetical protein
VLPAAPSGTVWAAGALVEVSWTMRTNHGGGYQWRIAPAEGPLTEAAFQVGETITRASHRGAQQQVRVIF